MDNTEQELMITKLIDELAKTNVQRQALEIEVVGLIERHSLEKEEKASDIFNKADLSVNDERFYDAYSLQIRKIKEKFKFNEPTMSDEGVVIKKTKIKAEKKDDIQNKGDVTPIKDTPHEAHPSFNLHEPEDVED